MDTKQVNVLVRQRVSELPPRSAIRLRCDPHDAATGDMESFVREYPHIEWSLKVEKVAKAKESAAERLASFDLSAYSPIDPTTLMQLLASELQKHAKDPATFERCMRRMEAFV
jgi:hypothetical protein